MSERAQPSEEGPLSLLATALLAIGATLAFMSTATLLLSIAPSLQGNLAAAFACQVLVYGVVAGAVAYKRRAKLAQLLALHKARPTSMALSAVIGIVISPPAGALYSWVLQRHPSAHGDPIAEAWEGGGLPVKAMLVMIGVVLGPLAEELFFRGVLLHKVPRGKGGIPWIVLGAVLFAMAHAEWQSQPSIFLLGLALGVLRVGSGSVVLPLIVHAVFNAAPFAALAGRSFGASLPLPVVVGLAAVTPLLVAAAARRCDHEEIARGEGSD